MVIMRISSKTMLAVGMTLTLVVYQARADVVVIVSADSTTTTAITASQISRIYLGKSNTLTPFDVADSGARHQFYTKVVGTDEAKVKARWSRLVFTGKAAAPKELSSAEVVKAVAADPNAIGYVDRSFVNMTVKVVRTVK
jgi:ABC-type phosphate transport system substrate-binding protein